MIKAVTAPIGVFAWDCAIRDDYYAEIGVIIITTVFNFQYYVMILLLFYRLKVVFDGTAYELTKCTIWAFFIMYTSSILSGIFYSVLNDVTSSSLVEMISVTLGILLALANISFLSFLFVSKLNNVNKRCLGQQNDDDKLISTITKQTILTLISISSLAVHLVIILLFNVTGFLIFSVHGIFIWNLVILVDVWSNFICILLSYRQFDEYYFRVCGCCDTKCKLLCQKLVVLKDKIEVASVESTS